MFHRVSGVSKACFGIAAGLLLLGLSACSGGSGTTTTNNGSPTVTQSSITLPSSVQVVSAK